MEQVNNNRLCVSMEELGFNAENGSNRGNWRKNKHRDNDGVPKVFTSKNLETERKRREKLTSRLLVLRSLVPIITNMNKASIIEDAITYTMKLQHEVESLTLELDGMEPRREKRAEPKQREFSSVDEMNKMGLQEEVQVAKVDGNKLWIKLLIEKKRGRFNKLIQDLNDLNIEMVDLSVTTMAGAYLITASLQDMSGEPLELYRIPTIIKY